MVKKVFIKRNYGSEKQFMSENNFLVKQDKVYNGPQDILFNENLMIETKGTKNSLIKTYFLINPLISRCENLKILSKNSSHSILLSCTI